MALAKTYNLEGVETGTIELDDKIFAQKANHALIYQVVRVAQANRRQPLAHTKDRSEVSGGGKKPWKQKGTGRARHGSIRSPLWKGGGVTFGPRKENVTKLSIPIKMRKKALRAVLSDRVRDNSFIVIDDMEKMEKPSSKKIHEFLKKMKIASKKVLFLSDKDLEKVILSFRNLVKAKSIRIENMNILDIMSYSNILINKGSIQRLIKQMS